MVWLELDFGGQVVQNLDVHTVKALLSKLERKISVGRLLEVKANAQKLNHVLEPHLADEIYDRNWAQNTAAVTQLLID